MKGLGIALAKSKASSKKTIVKLDERLINEQEELAIAQENVEAVASRIGSSWDPLAIILAEKTVKNVEASIAETEELIALVNSKVEEYLG